MSGDDTNRILGELRAMKDEHSRQLGTIFNKLEDLQINGCVVGRQHTKDIAELRKADKPDDENNILSYKGVKAVGLPAVIIAIAVIMFAWNYIQGKKVESIASDAARAVVKERIQFFQHEQNKEARTP